MLNVRWSVLIAAAVLGLASSIGRVDAASSCNPPRAMPCEIKHSLFGKDVWQGIRPLMEPRQSAYPTFDPSAAGTIRKRLPARPSSPVVRASRQAPVTGIAVAPAPAVSESVRAADRVAAVFRLPDPRTGATSSEPSSKLLDWVLGAAGLASLLLAKTADV
jgi:hypothetical protein